MALTLNWTCAARRSQRNAEQIGNKLQHCNVCPPETGRPHVWTSHLRLSRPQCYILGPQGPGVRLRRTLSGHLVAEEGYDTSRVRFKTADSCSDVQEVNVCYGSQTLQKMWKKISLSIYNMDILFSQKRYLARR